MRSLLLILISLLIVEQGRAQDTNSAATPAASAPAPVIGALEATNYYGQDVVVTGKVAQVSVRSDITFLNLDERYPDSPFTVVILKGQSSFSGDAKALRGTSIEIKGKVTNYHDKPEMLLNSLDQLTVVGVTNLPAFLQPATNAAVATPPAPTN